VRACFGSIEPRSANETEHGCAPKSLGPVPFGIVQNTQRMKRVLQNAVRTKVILIGISRKIGVRSWRAFSFLEAFMIAAV